MKQSRYVVWAVYAAGGLYILVFLLAACIRLVYPYEVEWNEGAVLDHAIRLLEGKQLYTAPSMEFAPFVYTPVYYFAVAFAMKIGGIGLWAGRLVSIFATLATALLIGSISWKETRSTFIALSSAMLYLAFYHATGFFYDIVRMDPLAMLFAVAAIYAALYVRRGCIIAAVLLALAYFTKQQMLVFWPAIAGWLLLRNRREAVCFAAISLALILGETVGLNATTNGWYSFYTLTIPSIKARTLFSWMDAVNVVPIRIFGEFALATIVIVSGVVLGANSSWKKRDGLLLLVFCYLCAMIGAAMSLGNSGGYKNVLMPFAAMVAILFPLCAQTLSNRFPAIKSQLSIAPWLILFEFASLAYNPLGQIALFGSAKQRAGGAQFIASLRTMPGDVWIPFHGYINRLAGKQTHIHFMAMNDVLLVGDTTSMRFRQEIDSAYASHRFAAIVLDENRIYPPGNLPHYSFEANVLATPNVFLSRIGDAPTRPQLVYKPNESKP